MCTRVYVSHKCVTDYLWLIRMQGAPGCMVMSLAAGSHDGGKGRSCVQPGRYRPGVGLTWGGTRPETCQKLCQEPARCCCRQEQGPVPCPTPRQHSFQPRATATHRSGPELSLVLPWSMHSPPGAGAVRQVPPRLRDFTGSTTLGLWELEIHKKQQAVTYGSR